MKNIGFKLWRWVGRKFGWYVEPPISKFAQFLIDEVPKYDKEIMQSIRPDSSWIGTVESCEFPEGLGSALKMTNAEMEATFLGKDTTEK